MKLSKTTMLSATALSFSAAVLAVPAHAQDSIDPSEASEPSVIVVTGSRISRGDFVSPSPIVTVDASTITDAGRATIDDYLRDLPQFTAGQGDFSNDSNGGTAGRATLNLRGLGPQRNLVLMDGQRLMSSGTDGAIDINTIPSLAIGGIEIISGGASATYGSDALSGVVNFRTRRDLDGIEVTGQISDSGDRDSFSKQFGAAFGTDLGGGRGYLLLSAEHVDRGGVQVNEREFFLNPAISSFITQGRSRIGSAFLSVNDDGTIFNQGTGAGYTGPNDLPFLRANGAVGYHGSFDNYLQVPLKRTALFGAGDYEIAEDVEAYFQGIYTTGEARNIGAAPNVAGAPWVVTIPGTNPFLVALRAANPGQFGTNGSPINVFQARITQAGSRIYLTENDTTQLKLGFRGDVGSLDLNWDVHGSYGRAVNKDRTISGAASVSALQRLLNAADGGNSLCAGGYNPFGGTDPLSAACVDYVSRTPLNTTTLEQWVVEGTLEGAAFTLPAGEARFAITSQFRQNSYDFEPDPDIATGDLANLSVVLPTTGTIKALEIGGEILLPLISNAPFAQEVNLTAGYRFADYNLAGSNSTFKAEIDARIIDAVLLRGGYQRAVRAPNVGEFFLAGESRVVGIGSPPSGGDPCDRRNTPSGNVLLLCQFEGVNTATYQASTASTPAINRGNRNLTPETANTLTAGVVFDVPLGDAQLQFSTDYYSIRIKDAISAISAADSLQQCYNVPTTAGFNPAQYRASNFFCNNFSRSGIGELTPIDQPVLNLGSLKTSGIDFATNLRIPADWLAWGNGAGAIALTSNVNYLLSYKIANFAGTPELDYAGTISGTTAESFPEWRAMTSLSVETGPLTLVGTWRHTSAMLDRSTVLNPASTIAGPPAYDYFDISAQVELMDMFELFGGINNVGDKGPPIVGGSPSATNAGTYDVIGRTFFAGLRARF
jgi:iron complex outermembrane recepter protein